MLVTDPKPDPPPFAVYLLGMVEFEEAQRLQRRLVYDLGERGGAALVLCEHPPTISVGRGGSRAHILPDDEALRAVGIGVHWVNRGGGCIFHLPGQLVGYLAVPLEGFGLTLADYVGRLHGLLVRLLERFDLKAEARPEQAGVFLGHARVATVGIAVNRWIAYHGFTLNVGPYLGAFDLLDEPGTNGYPLRQTSMESRRQRPAPMSRVREELITQVEAAFDVERHHLFTDHPLIRRKPSHHVYAPSLG